MAFTIRSLILIIVGSCSPITSIGQVPEPSPIELKFSAYAINPPPENIYYIPKPGASAKSIRFYTSAKSEIQTYIGSNPITFFNEKAAIDPAQPPVRTILARAQIPSGMAEPLFLFFPNPDFKTNSDTPPYLVYVFNDDTKKLPAGHVALINASGMDLVGQFNQDVLQLVRGLNPPIDAGLSVRIELRIFVRGKYYRSYQSTHTFGTNERALIILLPPLHPGSIETQFRILRSEVKPADAK